MAGAKDARRFTKKEESSDPSTEDIKAVFPLRATFLDTHGAHDPGPVFPNFATKLLSTVSRRSAVHRSKPPCRRPYWEGSAQY